MIGKFALLTWLYFKCISNYGWYFGRFSKDAVLIDIEDPSNNGNSSHI